jgi:histone H3/H4
MDAQVRFTRAAQAALDELAPDRIAEVGNYAKRLALADKRDLVVKADVLAATMAAGEEFLPTERRPA